MTRQGVLRIAGVLVAALVVAAVGVRLVGPGQSDEATLVGYFTDASPLDPGSQIRAVGVNIGSIEQIELEHGKARVTFEVDPAVLPLHKDARMVIRPVNLLGESYVDLHVGSPSEPYVESAVVPAVRTSSRVTLEDVLNTFDDPTSTALAVTLTTLGEGMHDSGSDAAAAIRALAPAMRHTKRLSKVLDEQNLVLTELVDQATSVARVLAADKGNVLDRTVASTEEMLSTVAAERRALDDALTELPGTLASARRTLNNLAVTAEATEPMLKGIRPVTDDLKQVTGEVYGFANAADPALASLKPVLERADELLDQARPAVAGLRKTGPKLRGVARDLRPLGRVLLDRHLGDLMKFVRKWSLSTNGQDALGNYFRGVMWVTPRTLQDLRAAPAMPGAGKDSAPEQSPLPDSLPPLPALKDRARKQAPPLPDSEHPSLPKSPPAPEKRVDPNSATGLTQEQELSLVGQLLGGS